MASHYKAPNKRIIHRSGNGRFRKSTLEDMGIPRSMVATGKMQCADCGHQWFPFVKTGICPNCESKEKAPITPTAEQQQMLDRLTEIRKNNSFGIDPRDIKTQKEVDDLIRTLRHDGLI